MQPLRHRFFCSLLQGLHCTHNGTGPQTQIGASAMVQPNLPHSSLASVRMCLSRLAKEKDSGRSFVHTFDLSLCRVIRVNLNPLPHANPIIQCLARTSEEISCL